MKKTPNVKKSATAKSKAAQSCSMKCCGVAHKVWAAIALVGLFVCGVFLGMGYRTANDGARNNRLDAVQCDAIANEIVKITTNGATAENVETLNELNAAYSNGCAGRLVVIEKETVAPAAMHPEIMSTCKRIEKLLLNRLYSEDSMNYWEHLKNADTYSSMADKGCAENADMYKALALRELEIATALQPEEDMGTGDAEIVIDTFKKLDMQREAQEFLDKIEKLIDPATDFILQMEQIINE